MQNDVGLPIPGFYPEQVSALRSRGDKGAGYEVSSPLSP